MAASQPIDLKVALKAFRERLHSHSIIRSIVSTSTTAGTSSDGKEGPKGFLVLYKKDDESDSLKKTIQELGQEVAPGIPIFMLPAGQARALNDESERR